MILIIDNYDSFTYNLYQYLGEMEQDIIVKRNDEITVAEIEALDPVAIVISPGPGRPENAGISMEVIRSFYKKIPIVHIEAGLRTGNLYSPFPEEANRSLISRITTFHMAPTRQAVDNLASEGIVKNVLLENRCIVN